MTVASDGGPPEAAAQPLSTATVVELRPLQPDDVERYVTAAMPPAQRDRWKPVFAALREQPDGALARALSTPLMAGIVTVGDAAAASDTATDPAELLVPVRDWRSRSLEAVALLTTT